MYTSISEFIKAKKQNNTKTSTIKENVTNIVKEIEVEKIKETNELATLESVINKLTLCHFIMSKGLINESSSLTLINEAIESEFGYSSYFKTEEAFNTFYVTTLEDTKSFLIEEGIKDFFTGVKTYKLDDTFKPSKEAETFIAQRKDTEKKIVSEFMTKMGMDEETAKKGALAMATFTNGAVILLDKYTLTFNPETKELKVDPNGKGILSAKVF